MIEVTTTTPVEEQEKTVDEEIAAFDAWFQSRGNQPLVKSERAILKTYFWYKLRGEKNGT
jgi:hypothetical protein